VKANTVTWPDDVDGEVFRRLASDDFDFSRQHAIDFNIDFVSWPPSDQALVAVRQSYPDVTLYPPEDGDAGYVLVRVYDFLSYELVIRVQEDLSDRTAKYGGKCESWGVFNNKAKEA
jgi:hypothetical protein